MATIQLSTEAMIGIIVGSVVGGILLLLLFSACGYFCCCRKKRNRRSEKPPKRIEETRKNGYTNRAFPPTSNVSSLPRNNNDELDAEKTVGYAYPIVGGRPVSYPYFGAVDSIRPSASSTSSTEAKPKHPVQRQTSIGLPPNAYRLPGLADKSFSMSDTNLSVVGTVNPAYDESGDSESVSRHIYRTQSLMNVDHHEPDGSTASSNRKEIISRLGSFNEESSEKSSNKRNSMEYSANETKQGQTKIRVAYELEAADHVYALPNRQKRKAPDQPGPLKGLPRIPLDTPLEVEEPPKSPERGAIARRSLTSEMSYQTKGNLVTDQAFDFLDGYADESPKS